MSDSESSHANVPARITVVSAVKKSYSLETTADLAGIHPDLVEYYCELGLITGSSTNESADEMVFGDDDVYELRRIETFRRDYGVNRQALPLVVSLLREVEHLEAELRFLRGP